MADDRTEEATPHKLEEARKRGQIPRSTDVVAAAVLLGAVAAAQYATQRILSGGVGLVAWAAGRMARADEPWDNMGTIGSAMAPLMQGFLAVAGTVAAAAVGISLLQTGLNVTLHPMNPDASRINPLEGFKRLFSGRLLVELGKTILKAVTIVGVGTMALRQEAPALGALMTAGPGAAATLLTGLASRVAWKTTIAVAVLAALDLFYQRMAFKKQMRMSRQDLKDEFRNQEGDPHVRARRHRARRAMAKKLRLDGVRTAKVVVVNPTHFAVALAYTGQDNEVPRVVAKGADARAHRIVAIARRHGVHVIESPPLARSLYKMVDVGHVVPPALYVAVAEVLVMVQRLDETFSTRRPQGPGAMQGSAEIE